jgi:ethanolamine ammonia-lyase large subunit
MPTTIVDVVRLIDKNKAIAAFFAPFVIALLGTIANWIATGHFNADEIRIAATGLVSALAAAVAAYFAKTKQAEVRVSDVVASTPGHGPSVGP